MPSKEASIIPQEIIASKIFLIRGKKIMFDRDLAELYNVPTKVLNQAIKRNIRRFPPDFMFQLTKEETDNWRSQIVTSNPDGKEKMGLRRCPYVFTEQGVAMLSSVLNSERAISVNIQIIRVFTKLREMLLTHIELQKKIEELERKTMGKLKDHDEQFEMIFEALKQLLQPPVESKPQIGFRSSSD